MRTSLLVLAPCLLVCLACATASIGDLEEGMTAGTVLEEFGEPFDKYSIEDRESVYAPETDLGSEASSWTYFLDEYRDAILYFQEDKLVRWEVVYDQGLREPYIPHPPDSLCLPPPSPIHGRFGAVWGPPDPPFYRRGPSECW